MSLLFSPYACRGIQFKNRVGVAPMCQYSSVDGLPNTWHTVHLGSRAVGGAGFVMTEAAAVSPEARISPSDLGMWSRAHAEAFAPINAFIRSQGAVPGIQLAHSGRKGSTDVPWIGRAAVPESRGGWQPVAPSPLPFNASYPMPVEMNQRQIDTVVSDFAAAARLSVEAGFEVVEIHAGHGYLLHEFLSPLTNHRDDSYGGSFDNRVRLLLQVAEAVRAALPDRCALFVRLSVTDWLDGGWELADSVRASALLKAAGVDLIDCSSGSILPAPRPDSEPGFQVPFASAIRAETGIATAAVGLITEAAQAEEILAGDHCDLIFMARALLRDPYWPLRAAQELDAQGIWPVQYQRAIAAAVSKT